MQYIYCIFLKEVILISTLRKKFKIARVENNLTQAELAEKVGVTRQTIGLIEKGKYNPTLNLCIAIALALNKTLDDLFWENSDDNR
ncbi:MAG: helix-turn-helix transcriptional regulator [Candidatus Latescibacteria bacterium]|nr:helix-turn-helix transcriptional regulator [Candidatus Latescibacterota bacterium]